MVTAERARELLSIHGVIRPQPPDDWTGMLPLPAPVERFFQEIGPVDITIESYGNAFIALVAAPPKSCLSTSKSTLPSTKASGNSALSWSMIAATKSALFASGSFGAINQHGD